MADSSQSFRTDASSGGYSKPKPKPKSKKKKPSESVRRLANHPGYKRNRAALERVVKQPTVRGPDVPSVAERRAATSARVGLGVESPATARRSQFEREPALVGGRTKVDVAGPFAWWKDTLGGRWLAKTSSAALYAPVAPLTIGLMAGGDINRARKGDFSFPLTRATGRAIGEGVAEDVRHPIENLPLLAADVGAVVSVGATATARGLAASKAAAKAATISEGAKGVARALVTPRANPDARVFHVEGAERRLAGTVHRKTDVADWTATLREKGFEVERSSRPRTEGLPDAYDIYEYRRTDTGERITPQEAKDLGMTRDVEGLYSRQPHVEAAQRAADKLRQTHPGLAWRVGLSTVEKQATKAEAEASRILTRLDRAHGLLDPSGDTRGLGKQTVDALNQAATLGLLYLRPGYVAPNLLGQTALVLTHHHFNPIELWKTAAQTRKVYGNGEYAHLGEDIKAVMGHGQFEELAPGAGGRARVRDQPGGIRKVYAGIDKTNTVLREAYEKLLDTPFRDSAFFYEARKAGYKSADEIQHLLTSDDAKVRSDLVQVGARANRALIDYARMGEAEREYVRRVVFFYPWMKGATMYAGHFVKEHPVQTAVSVQIAKEQEQQAEEAFGGPLASYNKGLIPVGDGRAIDPSSTTILGTSGDVLESARGLLSGDVSEAGRLANYLTPGFSALGSIAFQTDPFTGQTLDPRKSGVKQFLEQYLGGGEASRGGAESIAGGIPLYKFEEGVRHGQENPEARQAPKSKQDFAGQFGFGGLYPSPRNPERMAEGYREERNKLLSPEERAFQTIADKRKQAASMLDAAGATNFVGEERKPHELPDRLKQAWSRRAQAKVARIRAEREVPEDNKRGRALARGKAELDLLVKWYKAGDEQHGLPPERAAQMWAQLQRYKTQAQIDGVRSYWFQRHFGLPELAQARYGMKRLGLDDTVFDP